MERRSIIRWLLAAVLLLILCGCSQKEPEVTEITLIHGWGSTEADHVAMRQIYQDFEQEHADIRLNLISMPTADEVVRKAKELTTIGQTPDILFFGGTSAQNIYRYMEENDLLLDLTPYLEEDPVFAGSIAEENIQYWKTEDGALYTVCDVLELSGGYWYNKTLFREAGIRKIPQTWAELREACRTMESWAAENGRAVSMMRPTAYGYLYFVEHALLESDAGALPQSISAQRLLDAVQWVQATVPAAQEHSESYSYRDETSLFNSGRLAMYVNGVWADQMIDPSIDAAYALLPSDGQSVGCASANIGYVLGRTGDEKKERASVEFLKYMLSQPVQERILTQTRQVPSNPNVRVEDYMDQFPMFCRAVAAVQSADRTVPIPELLLTKQQLTVLEEKLLPFLSGELEKAELARLLEKTS